MYGTIDKKRVKKKGRFAVLNLQEHAFPLLTYVSVPRSRQMIIDPLRTN